MTSYEAAGGLLFAVGVSCIFANLYIFFVHTKFFPLVYVCEFLPLLVYRVYSYYHLRWHHYCLDFCYFLNVLLMIYVFFLPSNRWLFTCIFIMGNGPTLWGALVFSNKLVFHDIQSIFSLVMHVGPALATHAARFYWPEHNDFDCPAESGDCSFVTRAWSVWAVPCLLYMAHLLAYTVYVWLLPIHKELRKDPEYDNTFLYLRQTYANSAGAVHDLFHMFGSSMPAQYCAFALANQMGACVLGGLAAVCFYYRVAHVALLAMISFATAYYGGTFYFHSFSDQYLVKFFAPKPWTLAAALTVGFPLPFLPAPPLDKNMARSKSRSSSERSTSSVGDETPSTNESNVNAHAKLRSAKVTPQCTMTSHQEEKQEV